MVVLETLTAAKPLNFVLYDLFAVPFGEIAPPIGRTPAAVRQLASRGRRRVRGQARRRTPTCAGSARWWRRYSPRSGAATSPAWSRCSSRRSSAGRRWREADRHTTAVRVAGPAVSFARLAPFARPALVNGAAGLLVAIGGQALSVMAFTGRAGTVRAGRLVRIEVLADPDGRWP
jgi:hypothetical protein